MKIAIDALPLLGQAGGRSYLHYLLKHIFEIDNENLYSLFFRISKKPTNNFNSSPNVRSYNIPLPNRFLEFLWTKNKYYIPFTENYFQNPEVYFSTIYFSPVFKKCSVVSVVYDITTMLYDEYKEHRHLFDLRLKNTIKRSKYLIAISEYTKNELCKHYGVEPEKVIVVHLAAAQNFRPIQDKEKVRNVIKKYSIDSDYILYVGNIGPHKNLLRLVNVFEKLKRIYKIPHKLVLCGKTLWGADVLKKIESLNLIDEIKITGYILDEDLPYIYNAADLFVFISLYEGFGLPVLEAMSCGIPVVASNVTSIPEVVGDAGLLVNPLAQDEISNSILKVLNDEQLKNELSIKGLKCAQNFSWEKTARETLEVFKKALQ